MKNRNHIAKIGGIILTFLLILSLVTGCAKSDTTSDTEKIFYQGYLMGTQEMFYSSYLYHQVTDEEMKKHDMLLEEALKEGRTDEDIVQYNDYILYLTEKYML